ncbi:hypothetical protein [Tepidimonas thermarum]|uniref:hypothetical protein n=1 Tax=Tepidimonas thermarum TaxID=335431 RepID=UPI00117FD0A3|nr:hypothetical protein [Tepidimonas thermarum]
MSSGAPGGDEPMVLAAWIDMGQSAERTGALSRAATHYCAAARFGSLEAQYRLGGLLVRQGDDPGLCNLFSVNFRLGGHDNRVTG